MPTYQYVCTSCGTPHEAVQSFSDAPLTDCPRCGGPLRKVFSSVGVVFKGSGFYRTDSRGPAGAGSGDGGSGSGAGSTKEPAPSSSTSTSGGTSGTPASSGAAASSGTSGSSGSSSGSSSSSSSTSTPS